MEEMLRLDRPEEVSKRPTVALHLLVKNGASVLRRLIEPLVPYIDEIVAVVNDSTDDTPEILERLIASHTLAGQVIHVTAETHPQHYILDVAETYQVGRSLIDEVYEGPFTGRPLLADWAAVRNLGWNRSVSDWRLFLDADDVLVDPESLPSLCAALAARGVDLAASRYKYGLAPGGFAPKVMARCEGIRERLARNVPYIQWKGCVHEILTGATKRALLQGSLVVHDMRDSSGADLRVPDRNFKVLYHNARVREWKVGSKTLPPRDLLYMAVEIKHSMPSLAVVLLQRYMNTTDELQDRWPEERAWACCIRGEIDEVDQDYDLASGWYEKALREFPKSSKAAFRLCRSRFYEYRWQEAIDAYNLGVTNEAAVQQLDDGEVFASASQILVAACLRKLGRRDEAIAMCKEALKSFPGSASLQSMLASLGVDKG